MKNIESLYAAYIVIWAIFFVYSLTINSRIGKLRDEIERLKQLLK